MLHEGENMKRMLFNATQSEELRVAIVDGQKLVNFDIETAGSEQRKGNIYKGIITRIEPSLEACFVDYSGDRHGFLPFKEIARRYIQNNQNLRIQDALHEGQEILVQVDKDERGHKGAALTTYISLAGRYVVLMPNNPRGGGVSRRAEGESRQELKELMQKLDTSKGMSLIARTAGIGRSLEELQWDLSYLLQLWSAIDRAAWPNESDSKTVSAPALIFLESSLVIRAIRDYFQPDIGELLIDTKAIYEQASQFMEYVMPNHKNRVKLYQDDVPLFSRFQIEHQIETAFSRSVQLPSGGAIVVDHTEALVSIDVNSARSTKGSDIEETAFETNLEAVEEIARQLRLRDLGGLVVIDFIDMESAKNQRTIEATLQEAIHQDRARIQLGRLSRFGLLELSRQRLKPSLGETNHITCPRCYGIGFIRGIESSALHILRILQEEATKERTGMVRAQIPVEVATFLLNEKRAELHSLEDRLGVNIVLVPNIHLETPHYKIDRVRLDDMTETIDSPSYQMVEMPQNQEKTTATEVSAKPPEAVVKGVAREHLPKSRTSVVGKIFKTLFGGVLAGLIVIFKKKKNTASHSKHYQYSAHNRGGYGRGRRKTYPSRTRWVDRKDELDITVLPVQTEGLPQQKKYGFSDRSPKRRESYKTDPQNFINKKQVDEKTPLAEAVDIDQTPFSSGVLAIHPEPKKLEKTHHRSPNTKQKVVHQKTSPTVQLPLVVEPTIASQAIAEESQKLTKIKPKLSPSSLPATDILSDKVETKVLSATNERTSKESTRKIKLKIQKATHIKKSTLSNSKTKTPDLGGLIMVSTNAVASPITAQVDQPIVGKRRRDQQVSSKTTTEVTASKLKQVQTKKNKA